MSKPKLPPLPVRTHRYLPDVTAAEDHHGRLPCMCGLPEKSRVHNGHPHDTARILGEKDG